MKRIQTLLCSIWIITGFTFSTAVVSDVLTIPDLGNQPSIDAQGVKRPSRGMTMDEVSAKFGKPREILDAVGDPPITRWKYDRFTVHFEHEYVIHSVVHDEKPPAN